MFRVLIADDDYEDRELLKLEIKRALDGTEEDIRFSEAVSITEARKLLTAHLFDLMTLDIEFDRMNEGIDALPEIFETFPALNIIIVSGKLNKGEVSEKLFMFTKDNVLKGKRWSRHFDVLDKKDDKTEALRRAYSFAYSQKEVPDKVRELFLLAESYLERDMIEKCLEVYQKIQSIVPGEAESKENIRIFKDSLSVEKAREYLRNGDAVVAALLLGYHIETRLKGFTRGMLGKYPPGLYDCLKELDLNRRFSGQRKGLFQQLIRFRNKAIHHPATITEDDFAVVLKNLESLEAWA